MGKFSGCYIASDLDGTLLDSRQQVSDGNRKAIEYFIENGGNFSIATGRSRMAARTLFGVIPMNAPAVLSNGAVIFDIAREKTMFADVLSPEARDMATRVLERFPKVGLEIITLNKKYCVNRGFAIEAHMDFVHTTCDDILSPDEISDPWTKFLLVDLPDKLTAPTNWLLREYGDKYEMCFSGPTLFEFQTKGVTKGTGVMHVAELLKAEKVFTAGDQQNDLPMMTVCTAFAPENAIDEVKAVAKYIGPDSNSDFMAFVIETIEQTL